MDRPAVARCTGDEGFSLIEVLVSIVILGTAFIATMGGLATAIIATDYHQQQAQSEGVLNSAIEKIKPSPVAGPGMYVPCATVSTYQSAAQAAATDVGWPAAQVVITSVQYWNGKTYDISNANCSNSLLQRQLITVQVTNPKGRAVRSALFVKAP